MLLIAAYVINTTGMSSEWLKVVMGCSRRFVLSKCLLIHSFFPRANQLDTTQTVSIAPAHIIQPQSPRPSIHSRMSISVARNMIGRATETACSFHFLGFIRAKANEVIAARPSGNRALGKILLRGVLNNIINTI
jgi:hypothetical protein